MRRVSLSTLDRIPAQELKQDAPLKKVHQLTTHEASSTMTSREGTTSSSSRSWRSSASASPPKCRSSSSESSKWFQRKGGETKIISITFLTLQWLAKLSNTFESFNLFARWFDPQFDDENQEEDSIEANVCMDVHCGPWALTLSRNWNWGGGGAGIDRECNSNLDSENKQIYKN